MENILTIAKKEFRAFFSSPMAYVLLVVFTGFMAWWFFSASGFFALKEAHLRPMFVVLPWVFLIFTPAIAMRLWAEEKKLGTIEILLSLPLSDFEVVLGKFLACLGFLAVTLLLTLPITFSVYSVGAPDTGPVVGGYLGAFFLGAAYLSIGLFASSITENQIVAFILGIAVCFVFLIVGIAPFLAVLPNWLSKTFEFLSLQTHFTSISRGVIDSRDVIYYLTITGFFLFLNARQIQSRRWS